MDYAKKEAKEEGIKEGIKEGKKEGIREGKEKGIEEGKLKEKIEIAKNLILANMDTEFICETTGLDKKRVENLRN